MLQARRDSSGPYLSAVVVDYDNIYMALKRRNEDAAKRFAKDAGLWLKEIESGRLITPTNGPFTEHPRRIVMNRCYGNPVPRRNTQDNSTDMSSFPFVRHHFLRAGFEIIDCPPLTAQLKNSSDIRMVMDLRDFLTHETYFDEFVILSGDADFTPVLHRLRAHARRTVIFANDHTAAPYTALSDGEIREADLVTLLVEGRLPGLPQTELSGGELVLETGSPVPRLEDLRGRIIAEVAGLVRQSPSPMPLEALADKAQRSLGHDKTVGTGWAGAGSFRELLSQSLPDDVRLTEQPPFLAYDVQRHAKIIATASAEPRLARLERPLERSLERAPAGEARAPLVPAPPIPSAPAIGAEAAPQLDRRDIEAPEGAIYARPAASSGSPAPAATRAPQRAAMPSGAPLSDGVQAGPETVISPLEVPAARPQQRPAQAEAPPAGRPAAQGTDLGAVIQQSIARIHEACQAPPLAPPEYRMLFELMAREIAERGLAGAKTLDNITEAAQERRIDLRRDDVRFVLEVVSEADPWFEQGVSAPVFAGRFRNFVIARCRSQGLALSAEELDLVDAWFAGTPAAPAPSQPRADRAPTARPTADPAWPPAEEPARADTRWPTEERAATARADAGADEFPRILRGRLRG